MVAASDVQTALIGLIHVAGKPTMMVIVQRVSNEYFRKTQEAKWCMPIPRRYKYVTVSTHILKALFTISHCIQAIVIAHIVEEWTIANCLAIPFWQLKPMNLDIVDTTKTMKSFGMMIYIAFIAASGYLYVSIQTDKAWIWRINCLV